MMTDTWKDLQKIKSKNEQREKRRRQRELNQQTNASPAAVDVTSADSPSHSASVPVVEAQTDGIQQTIQTQLVRILADKDILSPCTLSSFVNEMCKAAGPDMRAQDVEVFIDKLVSQHVIGVTKTEGSKTDVLTSLDHAKLMVLYPELLLQQDREEDKKWKPESDTVSNEPSAKVAKIQDKSIESLLSVPSAMERENKKVNNEILQLLTKKTTKEQSLIEQFRSQGGLQEFCPCGTKGECFRTNGDIDCKKLHFHKIIKAHTDESLGDCSFLNTCFHMETCKYVHYKIESSEKKTDDTAKKSLSLKPLSDTSVMMFPPQWIQCDLRHLDMTILGKCGVVMADPPWDIHMELPYGTMGDDEMRKLDVPSLQDDGFLFLWVTGRAMELGRECMECWGYKRIEELIWVKTNQLQRLIRTGRTGHWINHGKEHCLVGVKGNPQGVNRGLDCDIIVAEVRATSHKPDEIYGIIERLSPGTRKVELFGRPHNVQPNWITLGNQLEGVKLLDPDIVNRFREKYPDGNCMDPPKKT